MHPNPMPNPIPIPIPIPVPVPVPIPIPIHVFPPHCFSLFIIHSCVPVVPLQEYSTAARATRKIQRRSKKTE
jgi:hypothetical protein